MFAFIVSTHSHIFFSAVFSMWLKSMPKCSQAQAKRVAQREDQHISFSFILTGLHNPTNTLPSLLAGLRLNSILSKLWASKLRNWGIPNLALEGSVRVKSRKWVWTKIKATANHYLHIKTHLTSCQCLNHAVTHLRIMFMVSLRSFPWNGNVPVSISNCKDTMKERKFYIFI